ncbi:MAG TPA: hypothetical protein VD993_02030 [Chitinophagaceae bacterium]|nr:hypothetical protein [Chitinophagaceae bacterium]
MKKLLYLLLAVTTLSVTACEKDGSGGGGNCNLPSTTVPAELVGSWVNGYTSFSQIVDAYNGKFLGTTWKSGRYLKLEANGKNAELYIMGGSMFSEFATKVQGTVSFNAADGSFQFHVCDAYYKGWQNGQMTVNRPATDSEKEQMTGNLQFYYGFENSGGTNWLQLRFMSMPGASPTSFRKAN